MEKNTTNYKFLNAKDRASERKNSHGILDTDRYHYKTAPHVQIGKRKRDNDGFFTPYAMFRPYSGTGLLCAIFGETPARKTSDLRVTQDMLAKEAYEHEIELLMCQAKAYELQFHKRFCAEDRAEECYAKAVAAGEHPDAPATQHHGDQLAVSPDGGGYQTDDSGCGYLAFRLDSAEQEEVLSLC